MASGEDRWPLRVQVVDTFDEPVVEATLELRAAAFGSPFAVARSGVKGMWHGFASGDMVWLAAHADCVGTSIALNVRQQDAAERLMVLMLGRPVPVTCLVLDANGQPTSGRAVAIQGAWGGSSTPPGPWHPRGPLFPDAGGKLAFEVLAGGTLSLGVDDEGMSWRDVVAEPTEVLLGAHGAFRAFGFATNAAGEPVPVHVTTPAGLEAATRKRAQAIRPGVQELHLGGANAPLQITGYIGRAPDPVPEPAPPDGSFEVVLEGVGPHQLTLRADGYATRVMRIERLVWPELRRHLTVRMERLVDTRGRIRTTASPPFEPARVFATASPAEFETVRSWTQPDGSFHLALPVGTMWSVQCDGGPAVACRAGATDVEVEQGSLPWEDYAWSVTKPAPVQPRTPAALAVEVRCGNVAARGVEVVLEFGGEERRQRVDADGRAAFVAAVGPVVVKVVRGGELLVRRELELAPDEQRQLAIAVDL
jgi:hypothetical protein